MKPKPKNNPSTAAWVGIGIAVVAAAGLGLYAYSKYGSGGNSPPPPPPYGGGGSSGSTGSGGTGGSGGSGCDGTCSCPDGEECNTDCGCLGSSGVNWSCNQGVCYLPGAKNLTANSYAITIPTAATYDTTYCNYVFTCGESKCNLSTTGGGANFTVYLTDQYGNPLSGYTLKAAHSGTASILLSNGGVTASDGSVTVYCNLSNVPAAYQTINSSSYPTCSTCKAGGAFSNTVAAGQVDTVTVSLPGTSLMVTVGIYAQVDITCNNLGESYGGCSCV